MSDQARLGTGRLFLKAELCRVWETSGLSRAAAISRVNKGLRADDALKPQTVGDWFSGTPAARFDQLWSLVEVFLSTAERRPRRTELEARLEALRAEAIASDRIGTSSAQQAQVRDLRAALVAWETARSRWQALWEVARSEPAVGRDPRLDAYLSAARSAADDHPYLGLAGLPDLPPLGVVYIRQTADERTAGPEAVDGSDKSELDRPAAGKPGRPVVPAESVFTTQDRLRLLTADAGGGKSTLLRRHLAEVAGQWSAAGSRHRSRTAIPILIRAAALADTPLLAHALEAAATEALGPHGLHEALGVDFFARPPQPGAAWLVMVDGLEEIPERETRMALVDRLVREAGNASSAYRFIVAARPLPSEELERFGPRVTDYRLQHFSPLDLIEYAARCFRDMPDSEGDGRDHAAAFVAGLKCAGLHTLTRTPLIASMMVRLYLAHPGEPLPEGRTGAYRSFVSLLFEHNLHKNINSTHEAAVADLTDRLQIPRDRRTVDEAAQRVREHLPELIDHVAHEQINGNPSSIVEILCGHPLVQRPAQVAAGLWNAFLGDLLRPTGLMVEREGDFRFLHQTFLEFHAARHATRDSQSRALLLSALLSDTGSGEGPSLRRVSFEASYLGFLVDRLLASEDEIARGTVQALEDLAEEQPQTVCFVIIVQARLATRIPAELTTRRLEEFARMRELPGDLRIVAAYTLAEVFGRTVECAELLTGLVMESGADLISRVRAAMRLGRLNGYAPQAKELLLRIAVEEDPYNSIYAYHGLALLGDADSAELLLRIVVEKRRSIRQRTRAAHPLALLGDERVAAPLIEMITFDYPEGDNVGNVRAAVALSFLPRYVGQAASALARIAADENAWNRLARADAAERLAELDGHWTEGIELLNRLAATSSGSARAASQALARLKRSRRRAVRQKRIGARSTETGARSPETGQPL